MSEEAENSGGGSLKSILIGLASTIALGIGGYVTKQLTGESDEPAQAVTAPAPVINITNSNQQAQQASGGGVKVVERVVEKPSAQHSSVPAPAPKPKKKEGDEFKEEAPKW
jgi:outer membrane scaffolding protein for murein synthesis (MipA/OmpV family)